MGPVSGSTRSFGFITFAKSMGTESVKCFFYGVIRKPHGKMDCILLTGIRHGKDQPILYLSLKLDEFLYIFILILPRKEITGVLIQFFFLIAAHNDQRGLCSPSSINRIVRTWKGQTECIAKDPSWPRELNLPPFGLVQGHGPTEEQMAWGWAPLCERVNVLGLCGPWAMG